MHTLIKVFIGLSCVLLFIEVYFFHHSGIFVAHTRVERIDLGAQNEYLDILPNMAANPMFQTNISEAQLEHKKAGSTQNHRLHTMTQTPTKHGETGKFVPLQHLTRGTNLSFDHLPRRQRSFSYSEITSADTMTSHVQIPDFTFLVDFRSDHVVLYEDEGVGCVHRVYVYPDFPHLTPVQLDKSSIVYKVDGKQYKYSLTKVIRSKKWPFLAPLNTQHKITAMGAYMPICYQKSMEITYWPYHSLPSNSFDNLINCTLNDLECHLRIYSAVSRIKYPIDQSVESFSEGLKNDYQKRTEDLVKLLENPADNGPDSGENCHLTCAEICRECEHVIFKRNSGGLISAIKMRVFDTITNSLRSSWLDILISINFDDASPAQIDRIPLGSLFGATGSLKEFGAAAFGKQRKTCEYSKFSNINGNIPKNDTTGYFYFPMPFWENVRITLYGTPFMDTDRVLVCHEITVNQHIYQKSHTGYFHAEKTYYTDRVFGNRQVLDVDGAWGQIVGTLFEVDNYRPSHDVSLRFNMALMESDPLIYIDGSKSASVLGTGFEDYVGFGHAFRNAQNITYAFVGNYLATTERQSQTFHFYRLHILDPVYFQDSIQFVMEGMSKDISKPPEREITYEDHFRRKLAESPRVSHLVLYYLGSDSGIRTTDTIDIGNVRSEEEHHFQIVQSTAKTTGEIFHFTDQRFIGAAKRTESFNVSGRKFYSGDKFSFTANTLFSNEGVVLKRQFYSLPRVSWNEKTRIWVNGKFVGVWYFSKGALLDPFTLREEQFNIGKTTTENLDRIQVTIEAFDVIHDIQYTVLSII